MMEENFRWEINEMKQMVAIVFLGLSDVDVCMETSVSNSDSGIIASPVSSCSLGLSQSPKVAYGKWEHRPLQTSSSSGQ